MKNIANCISIVLISIISCIVSCTKNNSNEFDVEYVETLIDSTCVYGVPILGICYTYRNVNNKMPYLIEEYVKTKDLRSPFITDSIYLLKYPFVYYNGDTLRGRHIWMKGNEFKESYDSIIINKTMNSKITILSSEIISLYNKKYLKSFNSECDFIKDISKNGIIVYKVKHTVKAKKINCNVKFFVHTEGEEDTCIFYY